jgi:PAS domain-containing protein
MMNRVRWLVVWDEHRHHRTAAGEDGARSERARIEAIPAFVCSASTDGRLTYVNQRLFDYIGAPMDALRGQGWVARSLPELVRMADKLGIIPKTSSQRS